MNTRNPNVLIIHNDACWRDTVAKVLTGHIVACIDGCDSPDALVAGRASEADVIVLQLPDRGPELITSIIEGLGADIPTRRLIALVPPGDLAVVRSAFRAGAWDCIEESTDPTALVECMVGTLGDEAASDDAHAGERAGRTRNPTGLPEHSVFLDSLSALRSLCRRHGQPLSIMMLDLDRFRECNERYSPAFGDRVLGWCASTLRGVCRRSDIVSRYQGDRFIVALPDSKAPHAMELAQRCSEAMVAGALTVDGSPYEITACVGIAESTLGFVETEHQLIQRARIAVDQAKRQGRCQTVTWADLLNAHPSRRDMDLLTVDGVSHWVERLRQHLRSTYVESTQALVAAVEAKDPHTRAHSLTVAAYSESIAKRLQLPQRMIQTLRAAALLHDIGKIGVPDAILTKPGPLTEEEFTIIKRHPETALEILGHVSFLSEERPIILHHHEWYDGSGYPAGLAGDRIPIGARVLAIADSLDTMFSPRTYKPAYDIQRVRAELIAGAGGQFDPGLIETTLEWLAEKPTSLSLGSTSIQIPSNSTAAVATHEARTSLVFR